MLALNTPPITFNKRVLCGGFSSGFNNKVKEVKQQKMTEGVNTTSSEPQTGVKSGLIKA